MGDTTTVAPGYGASRDMIPHQQETDFMTPHSYLFSDIPLDETFGSRSDFCSLALSQDFALIQQALDTVCQTKNQQTRSQAIRLLTTMQRVVRSLQQAGVDLVHVPSLQAGTWGDDSLLIEWVFPDFRVGFGIEPNVNDSSWYLVSNDRLEEVSASGHIPKANLENLVSRLLRFVLLNS